MSLPTKLNSFLVLAGPEEKASEIGEEVIEEELLTKLKNYGLKKLKSDWVKVSLGEQALKLPGWIAAWLGCPAPQ